jgi:ParB/RepB/Spo0J family partition protein
MASAVQKIKLSPSRDIPFNKLVLSQSNVRRVKAGVSIEQLAESIAQRTLLQSLSVRAVVDADGQETGMFEVPSGGRRYRALELLVKQKRMAKTQPVPCVVRDGGIAEDDSLAENDERVGLHPLDQFRAFQSLRAGGMSEEEIAARHFVTPAIVKQRLRLASVSPKLHDVYADDGMTLEQLMAFTVTGDHARQEQIWDSVSRSGNDESYSAEAIDIRHDGWKVRLPKDEGDLWDALTAFDGKEQATLFAHCASSAVNALHEPANRYSEARVYAHGVRRRLDQADVLARAVGLDMVAAGWKPTVDNYLGRVTKPRILDAVREAKGEQSVQLIDHLKKGDMAREAERLLDGTGWLPAPLRLVEVDTAGQDAAGEAEALPEFLATGEDEAAADAEDEQPHIIAAE